MASRKLLRELWQPVSKVCRGEATSTVTRRAIQSSAKQGHPPFPGKEQIHRPPKRRFQTAAYAGGGALAILLGTQFSRPEVRKEKDAPAPVSIPETQTKHFRIAEVKQHDSTSGRPWITRGTSVYDITEWVGAHPGGDVILRAAGGSIDPYWDIFTIHKRQDVYDILESFKIGEIDPADLIDGKLPSQAIDNPFATDPARDERLITLTACPRNAETPAEVLSDFLTPNGVFYIRNHMWVPVVDEPKHNLTIELPSGEEKSYTLTDLQTRFPIHKITATLQCSGNRRADMSKHVPEKQTNGLQWKSGAISNAEWEGVRLRDVLADAGLDVSNPGSEARHAQFTGVEAYGASIPLTKALDPSGDVLLAFRMNGQALPRDHGYPLRVVVPGSVAARSVKWLSKIVVSDEESPSQWQRRDYKSFGPNVGDKPDWSSAPSIQEMPVTSAITRVARADQKEGVLCVEGYAYSGGGREIVRVDVSMDGGESWGQARLVDDEARGSRAWCWKRWRYEGMPGGKGRAEVVVKATDESYNTQPEGYGGIWNARGNLSCAWHRVDVASGEAEKTA